jgi:hypothetical protein
MDDTTTTTAGLRRKANGPLTHLRNNKLAVRSQELDGVSQIWTIYGKSKTTQNKPFRKAKLK